MVSLFSRLSCRLAMIAFEGQDIFSKLSGDMQKDVVPAVAKTALILVGLITTVYVAFALRKYLAGDGRGDKEFVKILTGAFIAIILISAGLAISGAGGEK